MFDIKEFSKDWDLKVSKCNDHAKAYLDKVNAEIQNNNLCLADAELAVQKTYDWDLLEIIENNLKKNGLPFNDRLTY